MVKLVSAGQGGFAVTKNRDVYEKLMLILNHGVVDEFTELLASFGLVQLSFVSKRIACLNKIYAKYESMMSEFKCVNLFPVNVLSGEVLLYAEVLYLERRELKNFLQ